MNPWSAGVEALANLIRTAGGWLGSLPVAIAVLTFVLRVALIPILGPLAVRTRERMRVVRRIKPQIEELDRQFRDDPGTLSKRLKALHEENGIKMVDGPGLLAAFIQVPLLIAMFQAVLRVWEPQALTIGGAALGALASALSYLGTKHGGQAEGAPWMLWMSASLPLIICLWLGTGIALYLTGFYAAGLIQSLSTGRRDLVSAPAE